jgi:predicted short-subunit dehydrogenase-like oxidoreductase (DUF2520 family)
MSATPRSKDPVDRIDPSGPAEKTGPLDGLRVAVAGPGRVGTSLAHWARAAGAAIEIVAGRTSERAAPVAAALGARAEAVGSLVSDGCDLLLVAVSDDALDAVARDLARRPQAAVALHTAGSRGASALSPLAAHRAPDSGSMTESIAGAEPGSFHPLKAFPAPLTDPAEAAGTFFALDGPPAALALGRRLAAAFGGRAEVVPEALRPLYHLAASVAAGGVATLVSSAADLARSLGLPDAVGRGYLTLATGALAKLHAAAEAAEAAGRPLVPALGGAITGPVARGDAATFIRQMETLRSAGPAPGGGTGSGTDGERLVLFIVLALETARLSGAAGGAVEGAGEEDGERRRRELESTLRAAGFELPGTDREGPDAQG